MLNRIEMALFALLLAGLFAHPAAAADTETTEPERATVEQAEDATEEAADAAVESLIESLAEETRQDLDFSVLNHHHVRAAAR